MSLKFTGYSVYLLDANGKEIASGWSDPGPNCSVAQAVAAACDTPEFARWAESEDRNPQRSMEWQFSLSLRVCVNTGMH